MPDTGWLTPQDWNTNLNSSSNPLSNTSNINSGNDSTRGSIVSFSSYDETEMSGYNFSGTDLSGETIYAALAYFKIFIPAGGIPHDLKVALSNSGSSTSTGFSSYTSYVSDGGGSGEYVDMYFPSTEDDSDDWGLTWSGFTDISDMHLKFMAKPTSNTFFYWYVAQIKLKLYYTEASVPTTYKKVLVPSGKLSIGGGKLIT